MTDRFDPFHRQPSERDEKQDREIRQVKVSGEFVLGKILQLQRDYPSGAEDFEIARQKIHEAVFWMNKGITE